MAYKKSAIVMPWYPISLSRCDKKIACRAPGRSPHLLIFCAGICIFLQQTIIFEPRPAYRQSHITVTSPKIFKNARPLSSWHAILWPQERDIKYPTRGHGTKTTITRVTLCLPHQPEIFWLYSLYTAKFLSNHITVSQHWISLTRFADRETFNWEI